MQNMEEAFWGAFVPQQALSAPYTTWMSDRRFSFECPDEEVWIPSDQTIHWGKRPSYIFPTIKLLKKEELPSIPRGSRLVGKLWYSEWAWDEEQISKEEAATRGPKSDPATTPCFDDEKTMIVPFEKGVATFRHLRTSKNIKLQKTESFSIVGLGFEIGFHDPFAKTPFTSLEIFLSKPIQVHIVAHKGSVKLMQKHGLLPQSVKNGTGINPDEESVPPPRPQPSNIRSSMTPIPSLPSPLSSAPLSSPPSIPPSPPLSSQLAPIFDTLRAQLDSNPLKRTVAERERGNTSTELEHHKKLKVSQMYEILEEVNQMQTRMEFLKKRITEFISLGIPLPVPSKAIRLTCNPEQFSPSMFIFYAFRIRNLDLAKSLMKTFPFDVNGTTDSVGLSILHISARYAYMEGVQWCIEHGAQVNVICHHRSTPLHLAYLRNDKSIRSTLKRLRADKNAVNCFGLRPKDYYNQRQPLQKPPRSPNNSGSVEVVIPGFDQPFVLSIWFASRIGWLDVVSLYINNLGLDVDIKSTNGQTPLMCACEYQHVEVVKYLLQMGAHPNARDIHDRTPLHYGYMNYTQEIIELLEKHGADPSLTNIWNQPPMWYLRNNSARKTLQSSQHFFSSLA